MVRAARTFAWSGSAAPHGSGAARTVRRRERAAQSGRPAGVDDCQPGVRDTSRKVTQLVRVVPSRGAHRRRAGTRPARSLRNSEKGEALVSHNKLDRAPEPVPRLSRLTRWPRRERLRFSPIAASPAHQPHERIAPMCGTASTGAARVLWSSCSMGTARSPGTPSRQAARVVGTTWPAVTPHRRPDYQGQPPPLTPMSGPALHRMGTLVEPARANSKDRDDHAAAGDGQTGKCTDWSARTAHGHGAGRALTRTSREPFPGQEREGGTRRGRW